MTGVAFAALVQLPLLVGASPDTYAEARRQTEQTGRPLVVIVGAEWCPACQVMKNDVMPQVRSKGLLGRVAYAQVDLDRERSLGQSLIGSGPIPQLIMYRKTKEGGWLRRKLIGGQSVATVERFLQEGIQLSQASQAPTPRAPAPQATTQTSMTRTVSVN